MAQVEIKTYEGNKQVTETQEIKEMGLKQIKGVAKEINKLVKDVNTNDHLKNAVDSFFEKRNEIAEENKRLYQEAVEKGEKNYIQYDGSDVFKQVGAQFFIDVSGSFELILENAPESLQNLISIASDIEYEKLDEQNIYTFLDVVDAVVEVNDIPKLIERLKKSKDAYSTVIKAIFPKKEETNK